MLAAQNSVQPAGTDPDAGTPKPGGRSNGAEGADPSHDLDYGVLPDLIGFNLRISYGIASQIFARVFDPIDLAPIQFAALEFILRSPGRAQTEIAEHIGTTPSVLVSPLEKMERRELITRERDAADRRRFVVNATATGAELARDARGKIVEVEEELTANLTSAERTTLLELLQRMAGRG